METGDSPKDPDSAASEEAIVAGQHVKNHGINHLMIMAPSGLGQDVDAHRECFADGVELTDLHVAVYDAHTAGDFERSSELTIFASVFTLSQFVV